jgi:hypothetical protein
METYKEIYNYELTKNEEYEDGKITVEWEMQGDKEFEKELALSVLLLERVVFINNFWWKEEWEKEQQQKFSINVNCSDVFAWGSADAENLDFEELEDLFNHYKKDPEWGAAIWCIKKRGLMPQTAVKEMIEVEGIWDLKRMNLKENAT